jgi:hypothetical protein
LREALWSAAVFRRFTSWVLLRTTALSVFMWHRSSVKIKSLEPFPALQLESPVSLANSTLYEKQIGW